MMLLIHLAAVTFASVMWSDLLLVCCLEYCDELLLCECWILLIMMRTLISDGYDMKCVGLSYCLLWCWCLSLLVECCSNVRLAGWVMSQHVCYMIMAVVKAGLMGHFCPDADGWPAAIWSGAALLGVWCFLSYATFCPDGCFMSCWAILLWRLGWWGSSDQKLMADPLLVLLCYWSSEGTLCWIADYGIALRWFEVVLMLRLLCALHGLTSYWFWCIEATSWCWCWDCWNGIEATSCCWFLIW